MSISSGLVSVVIPVYNRSKYLRPCIDSVLTQTYPNIEIIVVDDGSKDDSPEVLRTYGNKITLIEQANAGAARARNRGIAASQGEFVAFLDSDDLWDADKIAKQVAVLQRFPDALAVYCDHRAIDQAGNALSDTGALYYPRCSGQILEQLILGNKILTCSIVMVRSSALEAVGGFDATQPYWTEDYDLWMRIAARGPFLYQLDTLVSYRRHDMNVSGSNYEMMAGNAHAYQNVARAIDGTEHARLLPLLRRQRTELLLGKAWYERRAGSRKAALASYTQALSLKPWSMKGWVGMLRTLTL